MQVGSFGSIVFEVSATYVLTLSNVKRTYGGTYEEHKVLGAKPRLEFLAPKLQVFSFSVVLSAAYLDIKHQLAVIQDMAEQGIAERLIIGGTNYGYFVLEDAAEEWRTIMTASVALTLKEYVQ